MNRKKGLPQGVHAASGGPYRVLLSCPRLSLLVVLQMLDMDLQPSGSCKSGTGSNGGHTTDPAACGRLHARRRDVQSGSGHGKSFLINRSYAHYCKDPCHVSHRQRGTGAEDGGTKGNNQEGEGLACWAAQEAEEGGVLTSSGRTLPGAVATSGSGVICTHFPFLSLPLI